MDFNVDKRRGRGKGRKHKQVALPQAVRALALHTRRAGGPGAPAAATARREGELGSLQEGKGALCGLRECKEAKTLDYFSDRQWERVRANRSAICLACGPGKGEQKTLKRKLPSGLARLDCRGCKFRKLEDAFPRAQLQQDDSEAKRRCLKCLKEVDILECSVCESTKQISEFNSAMATMPWAAVCAPADVRRQPKWGRAGWFTCRTCDLFFPGAGAAEHNGQRCLNCASRGSWAGQEHMPQVRRRVEQATRARERQAPKALPKVQTESKSREARVISDCGRSGQKASSRCPGGEGEREEGRA